MTMIRRFSFLLLGLFLVTTGCEDDPTYCSDCETNLYQNLTQRAHVLNNLEVAYNQRRISEYTELLDPNFTMFFAPGDFNGGKTPEQWGRADEIEANTNLFNPAYDDPNGDMPRCLKITLDVKWEDGLNWVESDAPGSPGEKWYTTVVFYNFQFDIELDLHLINNSGSKASFTVRNAGTSEAPRWQLVEMHDLDGFVLSNRSGSSTEQSSWGQIKALYR